MTLLELEIRADNDKMLIEVIREMEEILRFYGDINRVILDIEVDNPNLSWKTHDRFGTICEDASRMRTNAIDIYKTLSRLMTSEYVSKEVNEKLCELSDRFEACDQL